MYKNRFFVRGLVIITVLSLLFAVVGCTTITPVVVENQIADSPVPTATTATKILTPSAAPAEPATPAPTPKQEQSEPKKEVTVFGTNTGKKYHADGCQYLSKSKIPMTLSEGKRKYTPCSKCHPPQ